MHKYLLPPSLILTFTAAVVSGLGALAQTPTPLPKPASSTLRSEAQIVDQVCDFLKAQKSFTFEMDISYDDVLDSGAKVQYSAYQRVWVSKPNRLHSDYVGDERTTSLFYDGKSFTLYAPNSNYYLTVEAPDNLDAFFDEVEEKLGVTIPMSNLLVSDPCAYMKSDVQQTMFIGVDLVNREPMYHILLLGNDRDYQIWVTQDGKPLLRKAIITHKTLPESPQYTVFFSNWDFSPKIPANTFTFTPPQGAIEIESLPAEESLPTTGNSNVPKN